MNDHANVSHEHHFIFRRPYGTRVLRSLNPAINRGATISGPSGTEYDRTFSHLSLFR